MSLFLKTKFLTMNQKMSTERKKEIKKEARSFNALVKHARQKNALMECSIPKTASINLPRTGSIMPGDIVIINSKIN